MTDLYAAFKTLVAPYSQDDQVDAAAFAVDAEFSRSDLVRLDDLSLQFTSFEQSVWDAVADNM